MKKSYEEGSGESYTALQMIDYLSFEFAEASEQDTANKSPKKGVKLKKIVLPIGSEVEAKSLMLTMKPPHPHDASGEWAQVFFPLPQGARFGEPVEFQPPYFIRKFVHEMEVGYWMVDYSGVHTMSINTGDLIIDPVVSLRRSLQLQENLYDFMTSCNAVDSVE